MTAISVIVATCNRPNDLSACLDSLQAQTLPPREIVVVDDAPGSDLTPAVVAHHARRGPVTYVAGARRGLAAAHNSGLPAVTAPLVAFTDDDVVADPGWLAALHDGFRCHPDVACVTGKIVPFELHSPVQELIEAFSRFDKGGARRVFDLKAHRPAGRMFPFAAGAFGSGANMAFTRRVLEDMGGFDPALGAGTRAAGGDDLSAFFEVIARGHKLVYEPAAVVAHRHSPDPRRLKRQVYGYGRGLTAYLTKALLGHPELAMTALRGLPAAVRHILSDDSDKNASLPAAYPPELRRLERLGMVTGPFAYAASSWTLRKGAVDDRVEQGVSGPLGGERLERVADAREVV